LVISAFKNSEPGIVERVIDGDTAIINNHSVRFLGMNSPEKHEVGHDPAMNFLKEKIEGKRVKLVFGKERFGRYKRILAYVFLGNENINLESVRLGYSNYYFPEGKTKYYPTFKKAWEDCLKDNINLCRKSKNKCLILEEWNIPKQRVVLKNICSHTLDITGWTVKDEGRKKYTFPNEILQPNEEVLLIPKDWKKKYVWTNTGDSIFVRDDKNGLILFETY